MSMSKTAQHRPTHTELIVVAEPPIDVDRTDLSGGAMFPEDGDDAIDIAIGQRLSCLTEIDRQIRLAISLI